MSDADLRSKIASDLGMSEAALANRTTPELLVQHQRHILHKTGLGIEHVTANGPSIDPTGVLDSTEGIQAKIDATPAGGWCLIPEGIYKLTSTLIINKTIRFGGIGAPRTGNDNSDPSDVGVEFRYEGLTGDAILVQPPNTTLSRIYPILCNFLIRGNRNVVGSVSGGGLTLNGRALAQTAINGFTIENVHVAEAKTDGVTFIDEVYEGKVLGLYSCDNGRYGIYAYSSGSAVPGENLLVDIHTNDNLSDGIRLIGNGTWDLQRITSSRNSGAALDVQSTLVKVNGLQAESNTGAIVVKGTNLIQGTFIGMHIALGSSSTAHGVKFTGSTNCQFIGTIFTDSSTGDDFNLDSTNSRCVIIGHTPSTGYTNTFSGIENGYYNSFKGGACSRTTAQTIADNTLTAISWNSEDLDSLGYHDLVTNPSFITVPNGMAGYYRFNGSCGWASDPGTDKTRAIEFRKNNARISLAQTGAGPAGENLIMTASTKPVYLNEGDYVEMFVAHYGSGGTKDTLGSADYTWISWEYLGR